MKTGVFELTENDLRAHMAWLRRLATSLVGGGHADDAVQDTLVAVLEHPPALDRDVRPWLARVLANFISKGYRSDRRRRKRESHAGGEHERPPSADELLVRHEAARVVARLVSALREPHRELVLLRFAEGLTSADIARLRGVPEGTVRRQLKEALDELRGAVAAHYGRESRDWRQALIPLAANRQEAIDGPSKGGVLMTSRSKMMLGLGTVALAVGLVVVKARGRTPSAEQKRQAATVGASSDHTAAHPAAPRAGNLGPTTAAAGAGPPAFATAAAADPPGCRDKLARIRALAGEKIPAFFAMFERAKPSPRKQAEVAPVLEQAIGRLAGKAGYQLECRTSVCRVGVLSTPGATGESPPWLRTLADDLRDDPALASLHAGQIVRPKSVPTKDALTGATLEQHWLYFGVPLAADEEHPLEGGANATCSERVATLEKALDERREEDRRWKREETERQRRMGTLPVNHELTRRVEAALRPLATDPTGARMGAWECRGASDCRCRVPTRVLRSILRSLSPEAAGPALARQGLSVERLFAEEPKRREGSAKEDGKEAESEVVLVLRDGKKAEESVAPAR
jgi:RNA polymerase sigma-70 factor (ECF subfamily)